MSWSKSKTNSENVNNNNEFTNKDGVSYVDMNACFNNSFYAVDIVDNITASINMLEAGGSPSVEVKTNTETGYKSFLFNIPKGDKGDQGNKGTIVTFFSSYNSATTYRNNQNYLDIVQYNGATYVPKNIEVSGYAPTNQEYWNVFVMKGADGLGGNITANNLTSVEAGVSYALKVISVLNNVLTAELVEIPSSDDFVAKNQGTNNKNKFMYVATSGNVVPITNEVAREMLVVYSKSEISGLYDNQQFVVDEANKTINMLNYNDYTKSGTQYRYSITITKGKTYSYKGLQVQIYINNVSQGYFTEYTFTASSTGNVVLYSSQLLTNSMFNEGQPKDYIAYNGKVLHENDIFPIKSLINKLSFIADYTKLSSGYSFEAGVYLLIPNTSALPTLTMQVSGTGISTQTATLSVKSPLLIQVVIVATTGTNAKGSAYIYYNNTSVGVSSYGGTSNNVSKVTITSGAGLGLYKFGY